MIDAYVAALAARVRVPRRHRERILGEVREHLDDAAARLVAQGLSRSAAEQRAVESFGLAGALAEQFNHQSAATTTRRMPMFMAGCGAGVVGGFLGAAIPQPASSTAAPLPRQVAFFLGILGLQLAVIAGLRVSARVAAQWVDGPTAADARLGSACRSGVPRGADDDGCRWGRGSARCRRWPFRRSPRPVAGRVGGDADQRNRRSHLRPATDEHRCRRDRPPARHRPDGAHPWRAPVRVDFGSPGPVVRVRGGGCRGATAMMHAETTVSGALPWGVAQGAAVVGGYLLLGPTLELRA